MALSDMQAAIADELARSDLAAQITREIGNAITFYGNKSFWFNESTMVNLTTVLGQRTYTLPGNFAGIETVQSVIGSYSYALEARTEAWMDANDWGTNFWSSYPTDFSIWQGKLRLFPPPAGGLPVTLKGTVLLPPLTTTAPTRGAWAPNTNYAQGDTAFDGNNNIVTAANAGTSGAVAPAWSTNYLGQTQDNAVLWTLTSDNGNAWTSNAEELIRTRAAKNVYARYIRDLEQAAVYKSLEDDALTNLYEKNTAMSGTGWVRPHF